MADFSEQYSRRNIALLGLDFVTFGIGMTFLGPTIILPNLIRLLGGSPVAVGLLGTIQSGCWLLPQLLASRYVSNRPLVKMLVAVPAALSRIPVFLLAPALWWSAERAPHQAIAAILAAFGGFITLDALASVGWFDLVGKVLPIEVRGRLLGAAQSLTSLLAIGVGVVVSAILARPGPPWMNHVLLVLLAAAAFSIGPFALAALHEPRGTVQRQAKPGWASYLPHLRTILRSDPRFIWLMSVRWLAGLADMGGAFYILFATDRLSLPQETIGLFISAGVIGGLLCGIILGPLADRQGTARVITVVMALRCLNPALALAAPWVVAYQPQAALGMLALVFVSMGMCNSAHMLGFTNYLLGIAPVGETATYAALSNTLSGFLTLAPLFAGWLVQVASYEPLFALALGLAVAGLLIALRGPRQVAAPAVPAAAKLSGSS